MRNFIIILGNENSPNGELSPIAISRIERGVDLFYRYQGLSVEPCIIITGGHVRYTKPDITLAEQLRDHMIAHHHIPEEDIECLNDSLHTVDDFISIAKYIAGLNNRENLSITIVTSEFHHFRSMIIAKSILTKDSDVPIKFSFEAVPFPDSVSPATRADLERSEKFKVNALLDIGTIAAAGKLYPIPLELQCLKTPSFGLNVRLPDREIRPERTNEIIL